MLVTVLLVYELWRESVPATSQVRFRFFVTSVWDPIFDQFGALPFIYGTLVTAGVSLLIAVPLGIGAAIFLAELAPARVSDTLQFFIDLLAAVPSVIYGLLGVFVVIPLMREYVQPASRTRWAFCRCFRARPMASDFLPPELCWRSWSFLILFPFRAKFCCPCRAISAKPLWRWVPRAGNPPGK